MRVLYDGSIFDYQVAGGINRYFANLIDHLPENVAPTLTTTRRNKVNFPQNPRLDIRYYPRFGFRPGRLAYWTEKIYFRAVSRGFHIVHPTYYSLLTRLPWNAASLQGRLVVSVYDLIHERFPETLDDKRAANKRDAIRAAAAVLCISESTRRDLLEFYPDTDPAKLHVTYLASEITGQMASGNEAVPPTPYLLYVGGRHGAYKNFGGLLRSFAQLKSQHRQLALCVVGGGPFRPEEIALADRLSIMKSLQHLGNLGDTHLAKVYRHAHTFVYPSLYEGFGIPPLEAMACGTPVIVANCSSLPEVVGDAALRFDPVEEDGLTKALVRLTEDSSLRAELVRRGYDQAAKFSWSETARQTMEVYEKLVDAG